MTPIAELENMRSRRAELVTQMRAILDTARGEDRQLTAEERQEYGRMEGAFSAVSEQVEMEEAQAAREGRISRGALDRGAVLNPVLETVENEDVEAAEAIAQIFSSDEYVKAHREYMRRGQEMTPASRAVLERAKTEAAAYNVTTDGQGGYTVPETWRAQLIETRTQFGVLRQLATVFRTATGEPIHIPKVVDAQVADDLDEVETYTESEDTFGEVIFGAYKKGVRVKISEELINDSLFDMSTFISRRAGRAISLKEGVLFAKGAGGGNVTGVTVAAAVGVTTAGATAVTADELLSVVHSVSPPYRTSAQWVTHDSTLLAISKLVDDFNNYLWQPGLKAGDPDMIRGYPVYIDPFYDTIAAAKVIATFGDHSEYWIRDSGPVISQRLNELYAETGQVGFRFAERIDGNLVDAGAVKSLKTHA